jgi:Mlc titration factor MtfA (ptsG expression regulator)
MFGWLRRAAGAQPAIPDDLWEIARRELRLLDGLGDDALVTLRAHVARFLSERSFSTTHGLELTDRMRVLVAAQACLPVLHRPHDWLGHWHEVILYPGQFRVRRTHHDSDTDVVTEFDDELAGESWEQGPLILSWADVEADLAAPFDGFNVVIHEIVHKLDGADGALDGLLPMPSVDARRAFRRTMEAEYERLVAQVDADEETLIDPYAAECPEEFLAVTSEYHFSAPDLLDQHSPALARALAAAYGPAGRG